MATKDFTKTLRKDPKQVTAPTTEPPQAPEEVPVKKRAGRPKTKTEDCKTINIAVPVSLLEQMNIAKVMYKDNLTLYINKLIEKDLEANLEKYQQFAEMQQNMM